MFHVDAKKVVSHFLAEGKRISQVAEILGVGFWPLYRFISSEGLSDVMTARRGRRLSSSTVSEIRRLLVKEGLTPVEIRIRLGLRSRSTIYCIMAEMRRAEEKKAGGFQPKKLREPRICTRHGKVDIWPCVACAAEGIGSTPALRQTTLFSLDSGEFE